MRSRVPALSCLQFLRLRPIRIHGRETMRREATTITNTAAPSGASRSIYAGGPIPETGHAGAAAGTAAAAKHMSRCRRCGSRYLRRSHVRVWERPIKHLTRRRPYRCEDCQWRGWVAREQRLDLVHQELHAGGAVMSL